VLLLALLLLLLLQAVDLPLKISQTAALLLPNRLLLLNLRF
jgi:hypothetical protein